MTSIARSRDMRKLFILISGLPGSGKTTLARQLAPALGLPLIDKDDILDALFESKGTGDAVWRRALSRESDEILQREAESSSGAVVVSFWRVPGMAADSGTPTDWLRAPSHRVIHVRCVCEPEVAASRFGQRRRHPGHLDDQSTGVELLDRIREVAGLAPLDLGDRTDRIDVDTSQAPDVENLALEIRAAIGGRE